MVHVFYNDNRKQDCTKTTTKKHTLPKQKIKILRTLAKIGLSSGFSVMYSCKEGYKTGKEHTALVYCQPQDAHRVHTDAIIVALPRNPCAYHAEPVPQHA